MAFCTIVLLCYYIVTIRSYGNWSIGNSTLPRATAQMAVAYDSKNDRVWLLGGNPYNQQLMMYQNNGFTDYGINNLSHQVFGWCNYYTQISNTLWLLSSRGEYLNKFNVETAFLEANYSTITNIVWDTSCLTSFKFVDDFFLMIIGGQPYAHGPALSTVQIFNLTSDEWIITVPSLNESRNKLACITYIDNNKHIAYAIGGEPLLDSIEILDISNLYDISTKQWNIVATLPHTLKHHRAVIYGTNILIIGGRSNGNTRQDQVIAIDTDSNTVQIVALLAYAVSDTAAIIVYPYIYAFAGSTNDGGLPVIQWQYYFIYNTTAPTYDPTRTPTYIPTTQPTNQPSYNPTRTPTYIPTYNPTRTPTYIPTMEPTTQPSYNPTDATTMLPTVYPTKEPISNDGVIYISSTQLLKDDNIIIIVSDDNTLNIFVIIIIFSGVVGVMCLIIISLLLWIRKSKNKQNVEIELKENNKIFGSAISIKKEIGSVSLGASDDEYIMNNVFVTNMDSNEKSDKMIVNSNLTFIPPAVVSDYGSTEGQNVSDNVTIDQNTPQLTTPKDDNDIIQSINTLKV